MNVVRLIFFLVLAFPASVLASGDSEPIADLSSCSWVIALNPRWLDQETILEVEALLSRPDIRITNSVPYPYEPGKIISATFLYKYYPNPAEAEWNLLFVVDSLKALQKRGLEPHCDPGTMDPRLGTGT